jgi:undecaprenyl-diphosphatase
LDYSLHHTMHNLRTPAMDNVMILLSQLGDIEVLLTLSLLVLAWLLRCGLKRAALHWLAAVGFGSLLGLALFALGHQLHAEALTQHAAGNSLLLSAIACFGFLAVLITREITLRHRWWVYALALSVIFAIASARLYLGVQHLGSLLGVLTLGVAWVALLGIGYRNHPAERVAPLKLSLLAVVTVALTMAWHAPQQFDEDRQRYAYTEESQHISRPQWLAGSIALPAFRADLRGRHDHPLNLQYTGPLEELEQQLIAAGWQHPPKVDALSWLLWLNPATPLAEMPVLAQVHDGRYHELLLTRQVGDSLLALRLWRSHYRVGPGEEVLWLGSISKLLTESSGGLTVPRTQADYDGAQRALREELQGNPALQLHNRRELPLRFTLTPSSPDS